MQYGYFDDEHREYVITTPSTPQPWINYLGNGELFSLISHTAGGYAFWRDARLRRLTRYRYQGVPRDVGSRLLYIHEEGELWSPVWKPVRSILSEYSCRHGMGYTVISSKRKGIHTSIRWFIPLRGNVEIQDAVIENTSRRERRLEFYSAVEFCLWDAADDMTNFQRNLNTGEVYCEQQVISHVTEYRERRSHYSWYGVNCPPDGFDTDRDAFIGADCGCEAPLMPSVGRSGSSIASGWAPIAAFRISLTLQPGESRRIIFHLGFHENSPREKWKAPGIPNTAAAWDLLERFGTPEAADEAFSELAAHWSSRLGRLQVETGEPRADRMVNIWNQYQCVQTFHLARSASLFESGIGRGIGFRDTNQDMLGCFHVLPEQCRQRILDVASIQFTDGSAYHQYQPLTREGNREAGTGFNDDPLWLVYAAVGYIKETGDWSILHEPVNFTDAPWQESVLYDHLRASFFHYRDRKGPRNLPLIGRADWNDCLNLNACSEQPGESFQTCENRGPGRAESVLIAGIFAFIAPDWAELCRRSGYREDSREILRELELTKTAVLTHGWDGSWYLRGYDNDGQPVGSSADREGSIFIEPQGFCSMAGIGADLGYPKLALESVRRNLVCDHGICLLAPAFRSFRRSYGEITSYPPGYKENGGVFCHTNPWIMIAEVLAGNADEAFRYYTLTSPAYREAISELHGCEPYVYAQMIAGTEAPRIGEAKNSWLTGTAAWNLTALSQYILGIRPEFDGLRIDPALPQGMDRVRVRRTFRGRDYDILITRKDDSYDVQVNGIVMTGEMLIFPQPKEIRT